MTNGGQTEREKIPCWYISVSRTVMLTHDKNLLTTGYFNALSSYMMDAWEEVVAPEGTGHLMDIGERLLNLCPGNRLKVEGSLFCHKYTHSWTWCIESQVRLCGAR